MNFLKLLKNIVLWNNGEKELENVVHFLCGGEPLPSPLTEEKEKYYLDRLDGNERDDACNKLIEHNIRLVIYIAKRFENSGVDVEDLISIGSFGLIKAVKSFKNEKNIKLATYASRCIENEILMYFRSNKKNNKNISIDEPVGFDKEGNAITVLDILKTPNPDFALDLHKQDNLMALKKYFNVLTNREKNIVTKRYGLDGNDEITQKEIAKKLGISRSYVSRIEKRALTKILREFIKNKDN